MVKKSIGFRFGKSRLRENKERVILTVSAPPEYNEAADHLMLNSASGVIFVLSSNWDVYDGMAVPAAYNQLV